MKSAIHFFLSPRCVGKYSLKTKLLIIPFPHISQFFSNVQITSTCILQMYTTVHIFDVSSVEACSKTAVQNWM